MKKHTLKILTVILLAGLMFFTGCSAFEDSNQDNNIEIIKKVLTNTFTGPNEELIKSYKSAEDGNHELSTTESQSYYQDHFQAYFTEEYYETVAKIGLVSEFHINAYRNDVQMKIKDIRVEQNEGADTSYKFVVRVQVGQKEKDVTGRLGINEDGKIFNMMYLDGYELVRMMELK
ncbi:hypothetical protein [Paraliobacillus salinarum]|uniref:hypothetical protein n=1 Tax=Paraliobacillus salinarum TaxID=1158996 RepID=UPI0015F352D8|nr:hypothetical protein [Paraliobacillus salinarum]